MGFVAKLGLCWLQLTAEDQLESQGIQGGLMGSQCTQGGPPGPKGPQLESQEFSRRAHGTQGARAGILGYSGWAHGTHGPKVWIPGYLGWAHERTHL